MQLKKVEEASDNEKILSIDGKGTVGWIDKEDLQGEQSNLIASGQGLRAVYPTNSSKNGVTGLYALDLSTGSRFNSISGATGFRSLAFQEGSIASGFQSIALKGNAVASGEDAVSFSTNGRSQGLQSWSLQVANRADGDYTIAAGIANTASSYGEIILGPWAEEVLSGNATTWEASDRLFSLGNGASSSTRKNAITIFKSGEFLLPSTDISDITKPKSVTTKEYVDAQVAANSGVPTIFTGGAFDDGFFSTVDMNTGGVSFVTDNGSLSYGGGLAMSGTSVNINLQDEAGFTMNGSNGNVSLGGSGNVYISGFGSLSLRTGNSTSDTSQIGYVLTKVGSDDEVEWKPISLGNSSITTYTKRYSVDASTLTDNTFYQLLKAPGTGKWIKIHSVKLITDIDPVTDSSGATFYIEREASDKSFTRGTLWTTGFNTLSITKESFDIDHNADTNVEKDNKPLGFWFSGFEILNGTAQIEIEFTIEDI